jgi:hypothetical protein
VSQVVQVDASIQTSQPVPHGWQLLLESRKYLGAQDWAGSQDQTGETPSLAGTWSAEPSAVDRKGTLHTQLLLESREKPNAASQALQAAWLQSVQTGLYARQLMHWPVLVLTPKPDRQAEQVAEEEQVTQLGKIFEQRSQTPGLTMAYPAPQTQLLPETTRWRAALHAVHTLALLQVVHPGRTELHVTQLVPERAYPLLQTHPFAPLVLKLPAVLQVVQTAADVQVLQPVI